jgi:two-component system alkaline phosphatase synthesis response regulator PhoP
MTLTTTILIVDDDSDLRKLLRKSLAGSHRVIHEAATAEDGLRLALDTSPDVLLLDIGLPGLDGFSLCHAMDEEPTLWNMKTVIISGHDAAADIGLANQFFIEAYVVKPFSPRRVVELVERLEPQQHEMLVVPAEQHD